jgi:hypothetical protein
MYPLVKTKPSTPQELFERIKKMVYGGKWPSNACEYRTKNGGACAIGLCITDEEFNRFNNFENSTGITTISLKYNVLPEWLKLTDAVKLQHINDEASLEFTLMKLPGEKK